MFDSFKWRRGSGELDVIDKFKELARKASEEAHAEVTIILNFPGGYLTVVASTPEQPAQHHRTWSSRALAKGLKNLREWLRRLKEGEADDELRREIEQLSTPRKSD